MTRNRTVCRSMTAILITLGLVAGCTDPEPTPLVISDVQMDKVTIQADNEEDFANVRQKAREGCAIHDRTPLYISTGTKCGGTSCYTTSSGRYTSCEPTDCWKKHLFACVR